MAKYSAPNGLIERFFSLFPDTTYDKLSEIFELSKSVIAGWKKGVSVPKLSELEKTCQICKVDWEWLLTGRTFDTTSITYAFFPLFKKVIHENIYSEARHLSGYAIHADPEKGLNSIVYAVAALLRASTVENAPDPMAKIRGRDQWPDEYEYIDFCSYTEVPKVFLKNVKSTISKMRKSAIKQEELKIALSNSENLSNTTSLFPCESQPFELPVIGMAAADNSEYSKAELFADEYNLETVQVVKEHDRLIQIRGNSMEPVVLDGQYVIIGDEIGKTEHIRKKGWIGVVQFDCENADLPEEYACNGICTLCKRVYPINGTQLLLTSINSAECPPITVSRANVMHLWPVKGVLFAGNGYIPH